MATHAGAVGRWEGWLTKQERGGKVLSSRTWHTKFNNQYFPPMEKQDVPTKLAAHIETGSRSP
jgi:hypothetical protein